MVGINWTEQAYQDIENIAEYISIDSSFYAKLFVQDVLERVEQLAQFPESGRIVPEFKDSQLREILFGNYRIIYRFTKDSVEILTVYHSARLLDDL